MAPKNNTPSAPAFKIETNVALPAITRGGGASGVASPIALAMKALQLSGDPKKLQSFFIPTEDVPANVTDATERTKIGKEYARKISNRVSSISRRLVKADTTLAFAIRSMSDGNGKIGVRVFRVAPAAQASA